MQKNDEKRMEKMKFYLQNILNNKVSLNNECDDEFLDKWDFLHVNSLKTSLNQYLILKKYFSL